MYQPTYFGAGLARERQAHLLAEADHRRQVVLARQDRGDVPKRRRRALTALVVAARRAI